MVASSEQLFDTEVVGASQKQIIDLGVGLVNQSLLDEHNQRIAPAVLAAEQVLPVHDIFRGLLPGGGLQRGWTTRVCGNASSRAFVWALLSKVTTSGGWIATVDIPGIALGSAREVGVALERVLVVTNPSSEVWSATIGSLIGAVDVIVFASPTHRIQPSEYRRMASRCRERGTILVELEQEHMFSNIQQRKAQLQYDMSFSVESLSWQGLGAGHGRLHARTLDVSAFGRRAPGGGLHGRFMLPAIDGTLQCNE